MIESKTVAAAVRSLCLQAAYDLPPDVLRVIKDASLSESSDLGRSFLRQYLENAEIAAAERLPLCQDTGVAVFFVEIGGNVRLADGTVEAAVNEGVRQGYRDGFLRQSMVADPVFKRVNTGDNTPAVIHLKIVDGESIDITLAPKGGGSENMSALKMLKPSDGAGGVVDFVVDTVIAAGGNPCPPTIVGVGIGGNFEKVAQLAKRALLRPVGEASADADYAAMEREILRRVNSSGVGPQGLGGDTTAFAVHIEHHPCHIASLPVAVNLNCHAARHARIVI